MREKSNNLLAISGHKNSGKDTVGAILQYLIWKNDVEEGIFKSLNWTLQDFLDGRATYKYEIKRFADPIKDYVCILLDCTREELEDREFKEKELGPEWWYYKDQNNIIWNIDNVNEDYKPYCTLIKHTPRSLMQLVGTEAGREIIHPDIFVNVLFSRYKSLYETTPFIQKDVNLKHLKNKYPNWIITDLRFPNEAKAIQERNGLLIRVERPGLVENNHESEIALDNYKEWDEVIVNDGTISELVEKVKEILIRRKII